jgi:hypothetical protein
MGTNESLDSDTSGNMVEQKMYRSMIESLLYVTASRADVMFSVCMCARFQASPRESHLKVTKRILRYLKHTQNIGLWYPKGAKFELIGYSDFDYTGCKVERRSTSSICQYWEDHLSHGHLRNKIVLHFQPPKPNTLSSVVVVHKFFG